MKKMILTLALTFTSISYANTDLVLDNERWFGEFTAYVCDDGNTQASEVPSELAQYDVQFGHMGTTYHLDRFLVKATYNDNGVLCNYSAFLDGSKTEWTIALDYSKAYPVDGKGNCEAGKALIDEVLAFNNYKYLHGRAALYFPFSNSEIACNGEAKIGVHFQVRGRHQ